MDRRLLKIWLVAALVAIAGIAPLAAAPATPGLSAFGSDGELRSFLLRVRKAQALARRFAPPPSPPPPGAPEPAAALAPTVPSITNNQIAGVDEGDIVKRHGDTLVVLRRGRLLSVSLKGGGMKRVSAIDVFPPGVDARGDWYDEMLIAGDRIVVIGYSYSRGGTQLNRFRIDDEGRLAFEDSYQLRSRDYYSSRNYASRLIGTSLILYTPLGLGDRGDPLESLPATRRWQPGATPGFKRIAVARRVFLSPARNGRAPGTAAADVDTLHSLTRCDIAAPVLDCEATVVLGRSARTFFVSQNAIYLWTVSGERYADARAMLYRIGFDGGRPSAVRATGAPVDQFSFRPDPARERLQVVVRSRAGGDAMFRPEVSGGDVALLSIPMRAFGDGALLPAAAYRRLPVPQGAGWSFQNRFVGDWLLYGGSAFGGAGAQTLYAVPAAGGPVATLALPHRIERIEPLGTEAMIVGTGDSGLGLTPVRLAPAQLGETYVVPAARQGERRSHGFFFSADAGSRGGSGLMGIPLARDLRPPQSAFFGIAAAIGFFRREGGRLVPAGELSDASGLPDDDRVDHCQASCVDWYGNARPIFIGDRVFALLGYELVEAPRGPRISESARTNFMPAAVARGGGV